MRYVLLLAVPSLAFAPAPFPGPDSADTEFRRLRGEWVFASGSRGGEAETPLELCWVFSERTLRKTDRHGVSSDWKVSLDPRARPKVMRWSNAPLKKVSDELLDFKSIQVTAVYSLTGDSLTICYNATDPWTAPKDLSGKGRTHHLRVFKRKKP
jgi:uncharacterized protein (TIGR03067 family)